MSYWAWLLGISAAFALLERLRPQRAEQAALRPQLGNDLAYNAINGYLFALLAGGVAGAAVTGSRSFLDGLGVLPAAGLLEQRPFALQFAAFLVVKDFLDWCVHNLLHRVPALWQLHKVHHAAARMDWAVNLRFHWGELVVYGTLKWLPLLFLGGDAGPLFTAAVFTTAWGHFNHSNVSLGIGPLAYLFNSPRMHMWHHDASAEGGTAKNFGVVLSLWDWLFGTAYWPRDRAPMRLGYPGDEELPRELWRQLLFPLARER